jgi:hypothetical protein
MYLHKSKFQSHGHLTSANCYVNNRWVLKIGGFGLDALREEKTVEQVARSLRPFIDELSQIQFHSSKLASCFKLILVHSTKCLVRNIYFFMIHWFKPREFSSLCQFYYVSFI